METLWKSEHFTTDDFLVFKYPLDVVGQNSQSATANANANAASQVC